MKQQNKSIWLWPILCAAMGALLPVLWRRSGSVDPALPWQTGFGKWLRALSLSGTGGNLLAWAIVLVMTALPLIFLLFWRRRGGWQWADALLLLVSALFFTLLWFLVNPTLLPSPAGTFFPLACSGTILAAVVSWAAFGVMHAMDTSSAESLAAAFHPMCIGLASLLALSACYTRMSAFLSGWEEVAAANTVGGYGLTIAVMGWIDFMAVVPELLASVTLVWAARLVGAMGRLVFDGEIIELCRRTAKGCRQVAGLELLVAVAANLLQLLLLGVLRSTHFQIVIPLVPLSLSVALYFLCRCLEQAKALQDDNDSII